MFYKPIKLFKSFEFYISVDGLTIPRESLYNSSLFPDAVLAAYVFFSSAYPVIAYLNNCNGNFANISHKQFISQHYETLAFLDNRIRHLQAEGFECPQEIVMLSCAGAEIKQKMVAPQTASQRKGYIYLLAAPGKTYKIGKAKDVQIRLRQFAVNLPFQVDLVHTIPCENRHTAEKELQSKFNDKRIPGTEFFKLTDDDVTYIKSIESM